MPIEAQPPMTGPLGTETLQQFLAFRVSRVNARFTAQASQILVKLAGLNVVQWHILFVIADLGTTTSRKICQISGMDKGLVSRKLKELIGDKLVHAVPKESDQRQQLLTLTARGKAIHEKVLPVMQRRHQHILSYLSPEETDLLADILARLEASSVKTDF